MSKRLYVIISLVWLMVLPGWSQQFAVKTNILYDATLTPNLGLEYKFSNNVTGQVTAGYNAWSFSDNKKWKHASIQPEVKYWLCSAYSGHFFGAHLMYMHYNMSNIDMPFDLWEELKNNRYQGDLGAIGVSYGYNWMIGKRWSIEGSVGLGYAYTKYKKFNCVTCGSYKGREDKHLLLPTKLALSVVYYLK